MLGVDLWCYDLYYIKLGSLIGLHSGSEVKETACSAGDAGDTDSVSKWRRTPGGGYGNSF